MSRRVWSGILAGVLAAMALVGVAGGAYRLGRHDAVVRTVGDGEVVRVVGHGWGYGPGLHSGFHHTHYTHSDYDAFERDTEPSDQMVESLEGS